MIITNAFSLNMLTHADRQNLHITALDLEAARQLALLERVGCLTSAVGHEDTARVFSNLLGIEVPMNRVTVNMQIGDRLMVGQYTGPRLPEGATSLPLGASIEWWIVRLDK